MAIQPRFMAEGEQMFQQDVKSPPKCSVCTESCAFGGWGDELRALLKGGAPSLLLWCSEGLSVPPQNDKDTQHPTAPGPGRILGV